MKKTIFLYGLALAALIFIMRLIEYRFLVRDLTLEFYIGLVAIFFTAIGVWVGLRFTRKKVVLVNSKFLFNELEQAQRGVSKRELEVLELIAQGWPTRKVQTNFSFRPIPLRHMPLTFSPSSMRAGVRRPEREENPNTFH